MYSGPIKEVCIDHHIVGIIDFLVVAAIQEFEHAVDDTLDVIGEVDGVGFRFFEACGAHCVKNI